jgi:integrase
MSAAGLIAAVRSTDAGSLVSASNGLTHRSKNHITRSSSARASSMGGVPAPQAQSSAAPRKLTIRIAIKTRKRFMMLPTLPNDARDGESPHWTASMPWAMGRNQTSERKAMAKKRVPKRRAWNKGLEVGKRDGFTPDQVKRIRGLLADRGVPGLRDLALFSTAIDTMLHGQDLLTLVVGDVQRRDGSMRLVIEVARARGMPPVRCALSNASTRALKKWITASGKKRTDYLFPGRGVEGRHPMGQRQLSRLLKLWVVEAGLDPSDYSVESLRRTKALHILKGTGDLQTVRALLGHSRIESTARYLGLETKADPIEVCRAFDI